MYYSEQKAIRVFYFLEAMKGFGFALSAAIYFPFLHQELGLSIFMLNLLNFWFFFGRFLLEIPTGYIADRFGRGQSIIIVYAVLGLTGICYSYAQGFYSALIAELIAAVGFVFISGAANAWLIDNLSKDNSVPLKRYFSRGVMVSLVFGMIGGLMGALLGDVFDLRAVWRIEGILFIIVSFIGIFLIRGSRSSKNEVDILLPSEVPSVLRSVFSKPELRSLLVTVMVFGLAIKPLHMFWQPRFFGQDSEVFVWGGILFVAVKAALFAGSFIVDRCILDSKVDQRLYQVLAVAGVTLLLAAVPILFAAVPMFLLCEVALGTFKPLLHASLHRHIPEKHNTNRATIESGMSLVEGLFSAISLFVVAGLVGEYWGIIPSWIASGTIFLVGYIVIMHISKRS